MLSHSDKSNLQGVTINIPPEDYFRGKLTELMDIGLKWANLAEKVRCLEMRSMKSRLNVHYSNVILTSSM